MKRLICVTVFLFLAGGIFDIRFVQADDASQGDDIPLLGAEQEEKLDESHEIITEQLLNAANWFDNFFDNGRFTQEENRTRAKLFLEFAYTRNDDFEFNPAISLKMHLPKFSERANLIISANDDEDFLADDTPSSSVQDEKKQLSAAIQYFLKQGGKYNISTSVGASTEYLYADLRFRYFHDFGPWQGRFIDRFRYYTNDGFENKASYDLERRISNEMLFRSTVTLDWYEWEEGWPHSLRFKLYQLIDKERALSYEWDYYFDTEPYHTMTDLQLRIRYRQRFYRDWLVLEVAPQITFPESQDREANPGIIIKLEGDFGYLSKQEIFENIF